MEGPPGRAVGVRAIVEVDGVELTTEPLELTLMAPFLSSTSGPTASSGLSSIEPLGRNRAAQSSAVCPAVGAQAASLGTINGNACFLVQTLAAGSLSQQEAVQTFLFFGREGIYMYAEEATNFTYPPDLANRSFTLGVGCLGGDQNTSLTYDYVEKLENIGFSYSILFYSVGFSFFTYPDRGIVRGVQYDSGIQASLRSFFPIPINFSVSLEERSNPLLPSFLFVRPYASGGGCSEDSGPENSLEFTRERLSEFEQMEGGPLEDALAIEIARGAGPLFESLGSPGQGGLDTNVPAGSNADQFADYLSASGTEVREGQPNTSLDAMTEGFRDRLVAADGDTAGVLSGVGVTIGQANRSVPSAVGQAALLNRAGAALDAGRELAELVGPAMVGRQRFIAQNVIRVSVPAGEGVEIVITAEEIATLIERPVEDVNGATIIVNAGRGIVDEPFVLEGPRLGLSFETSQENLLVRTDVDLSTADGSFPADVSDWIVRPALRLIEIEAGPASTAYVTGPGSLASGGPASLSVQVLDEGGRLVRRPFSARFVDAEGNPLGSIDATEGNALFQYVPEPSRPRVSEVTRTVITLRGEQFQGVSVTGLAFSDDALVLVDGAALTVDTEFQVTSPEEILVITSNVAPGSHTLRVQNPEGLASDELTFSVDAE